MLGLPVSMLIHEVIGFKLREDITAMDLVSTAVQMLRNKGVVGKFVEIYGDGLATLPLADRATIANMAPEYDATSGFFPVDEETLRYLTLTGSSAEQVELVEAYSKAQGGRNEGDEPVFPDTLGLEMSKVEASLAGPKYPQNRVTLSNMPQDFSLCRELEVEKTRAAALENEGGQTGVDSISRWKGPSSHSMARTVH
ncbi:aconitase family protein [Oceanisphaera ostreae]|uniref:aconitate hydratase n=1 Tax=Oceanisphaera ostreae TaxID=914151 RepID=A0ABW3KE16_9GAMM